MLSCFSHRVTEQDSVLVLLPTFGFGRERERALGLVWRCGVLLTPLHAAAYAGAAPRP